MSRAVKGRWNIVLSGYPRSGKTKLAKTLIADQQYFARVGVDELRDMLFNEVYPCRNEFLIYSLIGEMRDALLQKGYSVVIDSTAPDNVTGQFLLATKAKLVNELLVVFSVDKEWLIERSIEKLGDPHPVFAYEKRWENPRVNIPMFKFRSNTQEEFDSYYARLTELLESEMHPFRPEFRHRHTSIEEVRKALRNFLKMRSRAMTPR